MLMTAGAERAELVGVGSDHNGGSGIWCRTPAAFRHGFPACANLLPRKAAC
jgi:hypothetical protein